MIGCIRLIIGMISTTVATVFLVLSAMASPLNGGTIEGAIIWAVLAMFSLASAGIALGGKD